MIIKDVNSMLDRQCIFSFSDNTRIEEFLTENDLTAIVRMRVTKDGGYAIFNFENEGFEEKELKEAMKDYSPRITKDAVMLKLEKLNPVFLEGFKELNRVPSVVMDAVIFNGGYYYIYFRFHSADDSRITSVLRSRMVKFDRFSIRYLGESPGSIATFREISSMVPLNYVEINGYVPPNFMRIFDDPVLVKLGVSWTREMKYLVEDDISAVFYDKHSMLGAKEDWITEISKDDRIYETTFTNPIIQYLVTRTSDNGIVTMGMPQKLLGKTFSLSTVVPEIVLPEFFEVVYSAVKEFSNWEMDIHFVDTFEHMSSE